MKIENGTVNYLKTVDSTNSFLADYKGSLIDGTAVYTLNQTAGRGRRGRSWQEQDGKGLALSVAYSLELGLLPPLPLIAGLSVAEALEDLCDVGTQLKWSNDIVVGGKKLTGILCDSKSSGKTARVVIGIGVNLIHTAEDFLALDLPYATSLQVLGVNPEPNALVLSILKKLEVNIKSYVTLGFEGALKAEYLRRSATIGGEILVEQGGTRRRGCAVDIDSLGGLICSFDGKLEVIYGGEASVRGLYGYV